MEDIQKDERAAALEKSIHCALLAPAGVQRTRLLATFYKDERSNKFSCYSLLEKMFKEGSLCYCSLNIELSKIKF